MSQHEQRPIGTATLVFGAPPTAWRQLALVSFCMVGLALAVRLLLLPGFVGTDDVLYAVRGLEISHGVWRHTTDPGELRFGIVLPIAAFTAVFGSNVVAVTAWSLLMAAVETAVVCLVAGYFWGARVALLSGVIIAVVPMSIILAGRSLADAPFSAFTTLAFAALMVAEDRGSTLWSVACGVALGACWWIKPTAAMPLFFAVAAYSVVVRRLERRWLWTAGACAMMIVAELTFLWIRFGDPLLTLRVLFPFLRVHQAYVGDPLWGVSSPWFYFHRLLLDGREMWILPFLALLGVGTLALARLTVPAERFSRSFVIYWAVVLLLVYSFFVISIHPLKLIPKQENYALIFVAPLTLLSALGLARLRPVLQVAALAILLIGGLMLAGLEQQRHRAKYSRLVQAVEFAALHPQTPVFASAQTMNVAKLLALQANVKVPANLRPLVGFSPTSVSPGEPVTDTVGRVSDNSSMIVLEPSCGELTWAETKALFSRLEYCAMEVGRIESQPTGIGRYAVKMIAALRPHLPAVIDRQLGFTQEHLTPPRASLRRVTADCPGPGMTARE